MTHRQVRIDVELDAKRVPERIAWSADEGHVQQPMEAKAVVISVWDPEARDTLRLDLWTKDMPIQDMKRFFIDALSGMGHSLLASTGDRKMSQAVHKLCDQMKKHYSEQSHN